MSRVATPATVDEAPEGSRPLLQAVQKQLGSVPNLFRLVGNSPAALEGYLGLSGSLAKGQLDARTRERIALAVAQINGCGYCLAAHSYIAGKLAKLDAEEIAAARAGGSREVKADAAVRFAVALVNRRGQVPEDAVRAVREAGYNDAQIVEIIAHVALNTLTNYINEALGTEIDFPRVDLEAA